MIKALTSPEAQTFIAEHENDNSSELALKYSNNQNLPIQLLVSQIKSRQKAKSKLPEWHSTEGILFPHGIPIEQCSSETAAKYKANLIKGTSLVDLTGGAGVDTFYLSINFQKTTYIERNSELCELVQYNFQALSAQIKVDNTSAEAFLESATQPVDWYYIDPARRSQDNKKVFKIADCEPNLTTILPDLLQSGSSVLVKFSPMLDIKEALNAVPYIKEVHVLSIQNECKEILLLIENDFQGITQIQTINISNEKTDSYAFNHEEETATQSPFDEPQKYLYEPNASILKAGAFKKIAIDFNLYKLNPNSHLYTSDDLVETFPGRKFQIIAVISAAHKELRKYLPEGKANLSTRNFPLTTLQLKKKLKLKDGGDQYIFATSLQDGKHRLIICEKVTVG